MSKNTKQLVPSSDAIKSNQRFSIWAAGEIGYENYFFLVICVVAQLATVLITWPLWEVRPWPINLPWVSGLPQFPFGFLMIASLIGVLASPKRYGLPIHYAILLAAILTDQTRCQPQVIWVAFLTLPCAYARTKQFCVWALVTLWLWAGLHKFFSSEWFQGNTFQLMHQAGVADAIGWCYAFALLVTISEIAQGVLTILRPRFSAITCALLHFGIAGFMIYIQYNLSVVPWNICTAIVGAWLMRQAVTVETLSFKGMLAITATARSTGNRWLQKGAVAGMLMLPIGFYTGHVRHCFAHVLYSGGLPLISISKADRSVDQLLDWDMIGVPFPREPAAFGEYFRLTAAPGEKMHIHEVRPWLKSHYYKMSDRGNVEEISRAEFYASDSGVSGIGCDDRTATFELIQSGAKMKRRTSDSMIFAISFAPESFSSESLRWINDLPNLEEIQLRGCNVGDDDLKNLVTLNRIRGIGLDDTPITADGLKRLAGMKQLDLIEYDGQVYNSIEGIIGQE